MVRQTLPNVWLLSGPLGSGKTLFARAVLRALGFTGRVTSPTFVLRHDFSTPHAQWNRVVHVDAYRVRDRHEEGALDLAAAAHDPNCLVLIEWPEKLHQLPGRERLRIRFSYLPRGRRLAISRAV